MILSNESQHPAPDLPPVRSIHARWAFLPDDRWHSDVWIELDGERIAHVEEGAQPRTGDLHADLLLPGLINAHCHLELTSLEGLLPRGPIPFGDWLREVINNRIEVLKTDGFAKSTKAGIERLLAGGATSVINTVSVRSALEACDRAPLRIVQAWEVLGLSDDAGLAAFDTYLAALPVPTNPAWRSMILNPHSPYSVGATLRALIHGENPAAWHLAETTDEVEIIRESSGSIAEMLRSRQLRMPFSPPIGCHPVEALIVEDLAQTCHIAFHLNHLPENPIWRESYPEDLVAVHCPGTHLWFERPAFPYQALRENAVQVALGTDSLASSPSLSMLDMIALAHQTIPQAREERLIAMATRIPAQCAPLLQMAEHAGPLGVIAPQAAADLVLLRSPLEAPPFFRSTGAEVQSTIVGGKVAYNSTGDFRTPHHGNADQ